MMTFLPSLDNHKLLETQVGFCNWEEGWPSLLLRSYDHPPEVEAFRTASTPDQLVVLITGGACEIESRHGARWDRAFRRPGDLAMTPPGQSDMLRWNCESGHSTLQMHIPGLLMSEIADSMSGVCQQTRLPDYLVRADPVLANMMTMLECTARAGASNLYAETAAHFFAAHLLEHHALLHERHIRHRHDSALRKVDDYLRAHLATPVDLTSIASIAGLDRFQLLRAATSVWGETPHRRLLKMRMDYACLLLREGRSIGEVSAAVGYSNSAHFATAFKRHLGTTPSSYRRSQ